jgi:hypothetical protein
VRDELLIVQFPHPGGEHRPDSGPLKEWNVDQHARKFMTVPGQWVEGIDVSDPSGSEPLVFWGEWEPQSIVVDNFIPKAAGWPRYLQAPFWIAPPDAEWRQNTDPYVFGDRFVYSNCRQNSKSGPRRTQRLARGSLVLFGSTVRSEFVLDTVFVVAEAQPMALELLPELRGVDETFIAVVPEVIYRKLDDRNSRQRLYSGASPSKPVRGMFSFFPCLPREHAPYGFARPVIHLPSVVNPLSSRNTKFTPLDSLEQAFTIWQQVVHQVLDQDLLLGIYAETPPRLENVMEARRLFLDGVRLSLSGSPSGM